MPTISVRQLDANHDPIYGAGQNNFLYDLDAVIQIVQTRLLLFQGEWWKDLNDGLALFQSILGKYGAGKNPDAVNNIIQARIVTSPYVTGISNIITQYNTQTRSYTFNCQVNTQFGSFQLSYTPGLSAVTPF